MYKTPVHSLYNNFLLLIFCLPCCCCLSRWVSGVDSIHHPMVWATCVTYAHSTALADKVWGEEDKRTFVVLIYFKGSSCPHFVECQSLMTQGRMPLFTMTTAAIVLQVEHKRQYLSPRYRNIFQEFSFPAVRIQSANR